MRSVIQSLNFLALGDIVIESIQTIEEDVSDVEDDRVTWNYCWLWYKPWSQNFWFCHTCEFHMGWSVIQPINFIKNVTTLFFLLTISFHMSWNSTCLEFKLIKKSVIKTVFRNVSTIFEHIFTVYIRHKCSMYVLYTLLIILALCMFKGP